MSYCEAMEAAGAEVLAFSEFGSYQGTWWAKVQYKDALGWVKGDYGSCSGCDAFEAEFGYGRSEGSPDYHTRLVEFGRDYLDDMMSQERAEESASENLSWDFDAKEELAWLQQNAFEVVA